jgi:hypothetical protein
VGDDSGGAFADRIARHFWWRRAGLRPRAGRNDGARHVSWQCWLDQRFFVLTGQHAGLSARQQLPEARPKDIGVLMYAALVLLGITLLVNIVGAFILQRTSVRFEGGA